MNLILKDPSKIKFYSSFRKIKEEIIYLMDLMFKMRDLFKLYIKCIT